MLLVRPLSRFRSQRLTTTGRNGGHLTAKGPLEFKSDVKEYGLADAVRQVQIEEYTTAELTRIIHEHNITEKIDFQDPGRVAIVRTDEEFEFIRESIEGAREAGVDVGAHRLLDKEEMQKVLYCQLAIMWTLN